MKRMDKRIVVMCIMLISCFFVSCGRIHDSKTDQEVGLRSNGLNTDEEEKLSKDDIDFLYLVEEREALLLQPPKTETKEVTEGYLLDSDDLIRDGEELSVIQKQYQQDKEAGNQESLFEFPKYLVEIEIPELYEKTQMRAYQAYSSTERPAGSYLYYNQHALPVMDSFEETCIADLDQNGEYELMSLYGFGSGIYRINLNVYQATNPVYFSSTIKIPMLQYHNCFVPKAGFATLAFNKVSDNEVHLMGMNIETQQVEEDYGRLVISQVRESITLENLEGFPFNLWDDVFNQDNWSTQDYDYESLTDIPELKVSVGDAFLSNVSARMDWNGKKEETIEFKDAMPEEVPQFSAPSGLYTYDQEIKLEFQGVKPSSILVTDSLITVEGQQIYSDRVIVDRSVRKGDDGAYYMGLENHFALLLSSNMGSYTNPSYRGFRVICEFGENRTCEYVFVLSLGPIWGENKK